MTDFEDWKAHLALKANRSRLDGTLDWEEETIPTDEELEDLYFNYCANNYITPEED